MAWTEKKKRFADAFLLRPNKTRAAIAAGCPEKSASEAGYRLFKDPEVQKYIAKERRRRRRKYLLTEAKIIEEMKRSAFSDVRDFLSVDRYGEVTLSGAKLGGDSARAIKALKFGRYGLELKFHDKDRALRDLLKLVGDENHDGNDGGETDKVVLYLPDNTREPKE